MVSGHVPQRRGTAHPNIVPYQIFATADGHVMLAVGNDTQFARFAVAADRAAWATDERFATNPSRIANRSILVPLVAKAMRQQTTAWWVEL